MGLIRRNAGEKRFPPNDPRDRLVITAHWSCILALFFTDYWSSLRSINLLGLCEFSTKMTGWCWFTLWQMKDVGYWAADTPHPTPKWTKLGHMGDIRNWGTYWLSSLAWLHLSRRTCTLFPSVNHWRNNSTLFMFLSQPLLLVLWHWFLRGFSKSVGAWNAHCIQCPPMWTNKYEYICHYLAAFICEASHTLCLRQHSGQ